MIHNILLGIYWFAVPDIRNRTYVFTLIALTL